MITNALAYPSPNLADRTADSADNAIKSTQYAVNHALDGLSDNVQALREQASPMLEHARAQANALARRGADGVRQTSDYALGTIRENPLQSVLLAAAAGAAVMTLVNLLGRERNRS